MRPIPQVEGVLDNVQQPTLYNNNYYQWATIDGNAVMFVNQNNSSLAGRSVIFADHNSEKPSITLQTKKDGTEYAKIGGGKAVELFVDGQPMSKIPAAAGGAQQGGSWSQRSTGSSAAGKWSGGSTSAPSRASRSAEKCYQDRVKYGAGAIKLMAAELGADNGESFNAFLKMELAAAVFNSSMYAFKDNIPLSDPVKSAKNILGATMDPADQEGWDDDECPF